MSLMGTLAKVAIGIAVAKGVGGMLKGKKQSPSTGNGGLLEGLVPDSSPQTSGQQGGGLGDLLGSVLGGQQGGQASGQSGGLGGLLEQLGGGLTQQNQTSGQSGGQSGGLGDLLGNLTGNKTGSPSTGGGALGDLLGGLLGKAGQAGGQQGGNNGSFGDILNEAFKRQGEPEVQPSRDQEAVAALMLRAMIQATKADGELDDRERENLLSKLGDVSAEEKAFVKHELQERIDVNGLARQVPSGLEQQVYMMSVMAIDLDSQAEAQYLHQFAGAMNIDKSQVNAIHDRLGVQRLYS